MELVTRFPEEKIAAKVIRQNRLESVLASSLIREIKGRIGNGSALAPCGYVGEWSGIFFSVQLVRV